MKYRRLVINLACILAITQINCGYIQMCVRRQNLRKSMAQQPSQIVKRELENSTNCTVYGKVLSSRPITRPVAVAAISYRIGKQEIVASCFLCGSGYYSLTVPSGQYQLLAFIDNNLDSIFSSSECIGYYQEETLPFINIAPPAGDVLLQSADISIGTKTFEIDQPISIRLPSNFKCKRTTYDFLSYPQEIIRSLSDTLFSPSIAELGIYNPSQFTSHSGMYFYALQNWDESKTPVLFIHGYGGTPREFVYLSQSLDTSKYAPVFFHYPSGQSLKQTSQILYEVYFSGRLVELHEKPFICIAHSMGGLVTRAAINLYCERNKHQLKPVLYISLCTPYGGVEVAGKSLDHAPEIIDSWRDIASGSDFLSTLHEKKLSDDVSFYLLFGYRYPKLVQLSENSDGTIAIASQLFNPAQNVAKRIYGFNETHESILTSAEVASQIRNIISKEIE